MLEAHGDLTFVGIKNGGLRMDALRKEDIYTIEDIYAPPNTKHQRLVSDLHYQIKDFIKRNNGECEVFPAPFAVFLRENNMDYVEPDISVICDLSKLDDKGCHGAPDWVIEVVSPSSKPRDYMTKLFKYRTAKVREYWIVDPDKKMVMAYDFEKDMVEQYLFGEDMPVGIYEGFSIKIE